MAAAGAFAVTRLMLRWSSALLILAAGAIHLYLWFDYFRTVHVVGTLFLLNFLAGSAIALALLVRAAALVVLAAIGFSVATLGAFAASVTVGLFGYSERLRGPWQEGAGGTELASLVLLVALLVVVRRSRRASAAAPPRRSLLEPVRRR